MTARPLAELVDPGWADALGPVADQVTKMGEFLREENSSGRGYLPSGANVLRAFTYPLADVRVLIVGQDPYPTPGHAMGLSFSVAADVRPVPRSLGNIFDEYQSDLGLPKPANGDLTPWSEQGVMLLNRVLTVRPGSPASHRGKGLGDRHRMRDPGACRARRTLGRHSVGSRRGDTQADAGPERTHHRICAPVPIVGLARLLWFQTLQPGE